MKPLPHEQYDKKPRHNAYSGSAFRARVQRIYLPAPVVAQARAEMQTGLSPRVQSDPLGALYGYAMEVPARAAPCVREVAARIGSEPLGAQEDRRGSIRTEV
jgi:hypothetical protein